MPVTPFKDIFILLVLRGGHRVAQFVILVLLARWLGVEDFGRYAFYLLIGQLVVTLLTMGFDRLPAREIPGILQKGQREKVARLYVFALSGLALVALLLFVFASLVSWPDKILFLTMMASAFFFGLLFINRSFMAGHQVIVPAHLAETVLLPLVQVLGLTYFAGQGGGITAETAAACLLAASAVAAVVSTVQVLWTIQPKFSDLNASTFQFGAKYLTSGLLIAAGLCLHLVNVYADALVLGLFYDNEMVGIYRAAMSFTVVSALAISTLYGVYHPSVAKCLANGKDLEARTAVHHSLKLIVVALLGFSSFLVLKPEIIVWLCGEQYRSAVGFMPWVAILVFSYGVFGLAVSYVILAKMEKLVLVFLAVGVFLNILFNFWLVPLYGLQGAAMATFFSFFPTQLTLLWLAEGKTKLFFGGSLFRFSRGILKHTNQGGKST